jgi:hypothetical protein
MVVLDEYLDSWRDYEFELALEELEREAKEKRDICDPVKIVGAQ